MRMRPPTHIHHYYGADFFDYARADTLTDPERLRAELQRLVQAGCDDFLARNGLQKGEFVRLTIDAVVQIGSAYQALTPGATS